MDSYICRIESTLVDEVAALLTDAVINTKLQYTVPQSCVHALWKQIGPRLTRLGLRKAGYQPNDDETDGWTQNLKYNHPTLHELPIDPADFGLAMEQLDPLHELRPRLGIL